MLILALNCGSSSLKCQVYNWEEKKVMIKSIVERIGLNNPFVKIETELGKLEYTEDSIVDHKTAIAHLLGKFENSEISTIKSLNEIKAVGHRIVHGGEIFQRSVKIDKDVIETVKSVSFLAPLHNPANLDGIEGAMKVMPNIPHIGIFDTAFHQTMPEKVFKYALPIEWYDKYKVRRYGFHGTSHLYVSKRVANLLGKPSSECNIIVLHIGNGVSITAIKNGVSYDTSMGMTPLEGAIMGTRSGDIDPAIPTFIQSTAGISAKDVDNKLNKESGVFGITGKYTDRRDIEVNASKDSLCQLAIDMECYRLKKYIGAYTAALGRVDAIAFTAGVGENSSITRKYATEGLEFIGIEIDHDINSKTNSKSGETLISKPSSKVKVFVVPTDEELVFVEDVVAVINNKSTDHMTCPYSFL